MFRREYLVRRGNVAWCPGCTADAWSTAPRRCLHRDERGIVCGAESSELSSPESKVRGRKEQLVLLCDFSDSSFGCRVFSLPWDCIVAMVMRYCTQHS
jgi:hypothetical protein